MTDWAWLDKLADAFIATWNSTPVEKRVTIGAYLLIGGVASYAIGTWLLPGLAKVIAAMRGKGE